MLDLLIGVFILNYAKLNMLQFYCDFIDKYPHLSLYEINKTDTNNLYISLGGNSLEELVPLERRQAFEADKHLWFLTPQVSQGKRTGVQSQIYWYQNGILVVLVSYCIKDTDNGTSNFYMKRVYKN